MGIAESTPENFLDADTLVKQADAAMYEIKKEKGFTVRIAGELNLSENEKVPDA